MARGMDTSRDPRRNLGPGGDLHAAIKAELAQHDYFFGTRVGAEDDGRRTLKRPAPTGGAEGSKPAFEGAHPNEIRLATLRENRRQAMAGLMQPPPDNERSGTKLVDPGLGREAYPQKFPVRQWTDPSIKK